jgi:SAM-dependent methyltransferase
VSASFYDQAHYYDIAFSFRDYAREVDAILHWCATVLGCEPRTAIELAAGPARHAIELAQRGIGAWALDLAPAMVEYARVVARQERVKLHAVQGDMTEFALRRKFDLALLMMDSANHILTADRMVAHLRAVGAHLNRGGVYVAELSCPVERDQPPKVLSHWTQERDGIEVEFHWGKPGDKPAPPDRVGTTTVEITARTRDGAVTVTDRMRSREWSGRAFDAAIRRAGGFGSIHRFGRFEPDARFDDSAQRTIYVLRKR